MRSIFCNFALSQNPFFKASYVFEGEREREGGRGGREGGEGGRGGRGGGWGNRNITVNKPKIRGELWSDKD